MAVKELHANVMAVTTQSSFAREAAIASLVRHENVVMLLATVQNAAHHAMVMERLEQSLDRLLHNQSLEISWETRWSIASGIAEGLSCKHGLFYL